MATDLALTRNETSTPRQIGEREAAIVHAIKHEFAEMVMMRMNFENQWEEVAQLILPTSRNTFQYGSFNWPGQKKTDAQIDASGMLALHRFAAICDSLLTPRNMKWHALAANDPYIMKDRATRLWFDEATDILFQHRYAPIANFAAQNNNNFQSLGAFGNATMFVDAFDGRQHHGARGLRYKSVPLGETYFGENHQGVVDRCIRHFRLTAYQAAQKWGQARLPTALESALNKGSQAVFSFLHCIKPRSDYDPERIDARSMPFASYYVSVEGQCLMSEEGGYRSFPYAISRYDQTPGEVYGRGPAMMVLPALKTLNAQKKTFLKQGHRAADPVLLLHDDGLAGMDLRPGAMNPGGVNSDGRALVQTLPTGNIQINEKMMLEERGLINDAFLVSLFQILTESPQMTATEVIERTNEKGILLAPTVGRQQSEYLGPMIDRELDVLAEQGLLPPMPPRLREAEGEYQVVYTSPLAKAQRAQEAAGFWRWADQLVRYAHETGEVSSMDRIDFSAAAPELADIMGVPVRWVASDDAVQAKMRGRAQQQQRQERIAAAPSQAAMMKAEAAQVKAGMRPTDEGAA